MMGMMILKELWEGMHLDHILETSDFKGGVK